MKAQKQKHQTKELTPCKGRPEMPKHFVHELRKQWERVCEELEQMGTLYTADREVIALYCTAWCRWIKAEAEIVKTGGEICLSPTKQVPMHSPWSSVSYKAQEQVIKCAQELGLTPAARGKIKLPDKEEDKTEDFSDLEQG